MQVILVSWGLPCQPSWDIYSDIGMVGVQFKCILIRWSFICLYDWLVITMSPTMSYWFLLKKVGILWTKWMGWKWGITELATFMPLTRTTVCYGKFSRYIQNKICKYGIRLSWKQQNTHDMSKTMAPRGVGLIFRIYLHRKLYNSSCHILHDQFQYYLAGMLLWWPSTKIVQAIMIHQKTWLPWGGAYFPYISK